MKAPHPLVLLILDGWGVAPPGSGNAITRARPATYRRLMRRFSHTALDASGSAVGLPPRQNGNSEAGHMNIGAGRIVEQDAVRINLLIHDGRFFKNPALLEAITHVKRRKSTLHLMGLLTGPQSGHAFPLHLQALIHLARTHGELPTALHLFTDGRDTSKFAASVLLAKIEALLGPRQHIATIGGRFWSMDRAKRWSRTERAFNALVDGAGKTSPTAQQAVFLAYNRGESDEFISPTAIGRTAALRKAGRIASGDAVVFFNLRSDRARQMAKPFVQERFERMNRGSFRRRKLLNNLVFVALTEFGPDLPNILTAFPSITLPETLPMALADRRQLYLAESEKYAHITYFFNGGYAQPIAGEDRLMVPSSNVTSFDQRPAMETPKLAAIIAKDVVRQGHDVIVANFANVDMVGHTGNLHAGERAVAAIDAALRTVAAAVLKRRGLLLITADHGNIEEMKDKKTRDRNTEHSGNPVPFILVGSHRHCKPKGRLADIAPTLLELLDLPQPRSMTGHSLLRS